MNRITVLIFFLLFMGVQACAQSHSYNFSNPEEKIILPQVLHEISGLTMLTQNSFACVQDELGTVFFYNLDSKKIDQTIQFEKAGDFEGITEVGENLYILRSDGRLTKLENYKSEDYKIETYNTKVPAKDNEGLCYDEENNRLLIGCKGKLDSDHAEEDQRAIYGFDLKTNKISASPAFLFNVNEMMDFANSNGIKLASKKKKEGSLKFQISAIAIHPISKKLYVISAKDHLVFVFDQNGKPEYVELLDDNLFNKAEGMTFLANGDLLITNEGQDQKPTLLRFKMQPKK